ncbi:MAG: hypothetical protein WBD90_22355 [Xanthobacteraceae bacterium]
MLNLECHDGGDDADDEPAERRVKEHHPHPGRAFTVEIIGAVGTGDIAEGDGEKAEDGARR